MLCSGSIIKDWSVGFGSEVVSRAYVTAADAPLSSALFTCVATSYEPDTVDQLCGLKFGSLAALPILPTVTCTQGIGIETNPLFYAFAGGMLSNASTTITLTYSAPTAITTITPKVLPDPATGQYPDRLDYEVIVDGVSKGVKSVVPDATTAISISIAASCTVVKLVLLSVGTGIVSDCLPSATKQSTALPPIVDVWVMDVAYGNFTKVPHVVTASGVLLQPAMLVPKWST